MHRAAVPWKHPLFFKQCRALRQYLLLVYTNILYLRKYSSYYSLKQV